MTLDDVRRLYRKVQAPPHGYFDVWNRKGGSPFRAGLEPADYQPFIDHFTERAQTARAQAHRYARKGRDDDARRWAGFAAGWEHAAGVCRMRQERAELAAVRRQQAEPVERPAFMWDD